MNGRESGDLLDRRTVLTALSAAGVASLSGCSGTGLSGGDQPTSGSTPSRSEGQTTDHATPPSDEETAGDEKAVVNCPDPPPLSSCLGRVAPVATDAGDGCATSDGDSAPTTGPGAANWFGFGDCGSWKEYSVDPGTEYRLDVYAGACTPLSDVDFSVMEPDGSGGWRVSRHVPKRRADIPSERVHRVWVTPETDTMRIERADETDPDDFYVTVSRNPRWGGSKSTRLPTREIVVGEDDLPTYARVDSSIDATVRYQGVASQGVTWNDVRTDGDRLVYTLGLTGQLLTRRTEIPGADGELAIRGPKPDAHPASDVSQPITIPTHTIKRQGYTVDTPGAAAVESFSDRYMEDRSDWRYGTTDSTVEPDEEKSLGTVVGRAFAPSVSPSSLASSAAQNGVMWATERLLGAGVREVSDGALGYLFTFTDLWTSFAETCDNWERNETDSLDQGLSRITSVCKGAGLVANFAQIELSVPKDASARVTISHEFLAGRPFEMASPTLEREFVLNPDGDGTVRRRRAAVPGSDAGPSDTSVLLTEGFEDGLGAFEDTSQASVSPAHTTDYVAEGERALDLRSTPGTDTANRVRTSEAFDTPLAASVAVDRYESDGPENATGLRLVSADSDREVSLKWSRYYPGVRMRVFGSDGEVRNEQMITSLDADGWHRMGIAITSAGEIVCTASGQSVSYEPDADWTGDAYTMELLANGWGHGHAVAAAFDSVRVERPGSSSGCGTDAGRRTPVTADR